MYVGMNLKPEFTRQDRVSVPHVRGDEPEYGARFEP